MTRLTGVPCLLACGITALLGAQRAGVQGQPSGVWPTAAWQTATPESQGLAAAPLAALDRDVQAGVYGYVDRLLVARHGRLVANHTYARDYRAISRGRIGPLGCGEGCTDPAAMHEYNYLHPNWHPYYQGRGVHTLQSVTKSVAATLVAIAIGRGEIGAVDRPFLEYLTDRDLSRVDARLRRATLADLLTMRSGIEWHESDRPLDDTNTTLQLERSRDWIAFTLAQPMDADPGTKWAYNSGGSQLLSGIVRSTTGRFIDDTRASICSDRSGFATSIGRRPPPATRTPKVACISRLRTWRRSATCIFATASGTPVASCPTAGSPTRPPRTHGRSHPAGTTATSGG
jgi:CubicO group peptidase (beta-lactamase class C family)